MLLHAGALHAELAEAHAVVDSTAQAVEAAKAELALAIAARTALSEEKDALATEVSLQQMQVAQLEKQLVELHLQAQNSSGQVSCKAVFDCKASKARCRVKSRFHPIVACTCGSCR